MEAPKTCTTESASHVEIENNFSLDTVDTVHADEGIKVLVAYDGDSSWSAEEEMALLRKLDRRLLPILFGSFFLLNYDRTMLGQAALFGLREELHLISGNRYSFTASIYYLGYIAGAYPATLLAQKFPVEYLASTVVCVWGIVIIITPACSSFQGLYADRFFLGFVEAGIGPMFMLIVGSWYKKDEQALRMGIWFSCIGLTTIIAPLVNYGLGHIHGNLSPWKYMYLFAGSITIPWAVVVFALLPSNPARAWMITERQRYIAVARLRTNNSGVRNTQFKTRQALELLIDPKFWLMVICAFLSTIANGPISAYTTIIIRSFGFSLLDSLLLVAPSGVYVGAAVLAGTWAARRFPNVRVYLFCLFEIGVIISALLLWLLPAHATGALLFGCYLLTSAGAAYPLLMGLVVANTAGYTKRSLASAGLFVGYCLGNFTGPLFFKASDAPRYPHGFMGVLTTAAAAITLSLIYRLLCVRDNRRRDMAGTHEAFEHAYDDDLTDKINPQFRYAM